MAEYIKRDSLGIGYADPKVFDNPAYAEGWNGAIKIINEAPASDVAPVKHGHWIDKTVWWGGIGRCRYQCSVCGKYIGYKPNTAESGDMAKDNYCKNCGAKMDEEDDNE